MDADRFDSLTRTLTAARSRRRALHALAGSAVASLFTRGVGDAEAHNPLKKCKKKSGKAKKKCVKKAKKHNPQDATNVSPPRPLPPPLPPRCGTGGPCLVFVTSTTHQGNLGGLAGADLICQQRAQARSLPGTYKAWLSDSTGSPDSRFAKSAGPYRRLDGVTVADNYTDLTTCDSSAPFACLANQIDLLDDGVTRTNGTQIWTNTVAGGTEESPARSCDNWTKAVSDLEGNIGFSDKDITVTDKGWTDKGSVQNCNFEFTHLYCFQQS